jgi:CDP-glucose 4,6-dehydratase
VRDLVSAVVAAWGGGEVVLPDPAAELPVEARSLAIDACKARDRLGWSPRLAFDEAIAWTVAGYRAESPDHQAVRAHRREQIARYGASEGAAP